MWNHKDPTDRHEPMPMKHYPDLCFWCGQTIENEIHIQDNSGESNAGRRQED